MQVKVGNVQVYPVSIYQDTCHIIVCASVVHGRFIDMELRSCTSFLSPCSALASELA